MNARAAAVHTARRAGRFNLVAAIVVVAAIAVFAVKAQAERESVPSRHFAPWSVSETCPLMTAREAGRKALDFRAKSQASSC